MENIRQKKVELIAAWFRNLEFIREAIRDKIKKIKKDNALEELKKYFGKAKVKTSYEEERKIT